jgi:hypothetical protein
MKKHHSYMIYRVMVRLDEQAEIALRYGRERDAWSISKLIGRLEYQHFGAVSFEASFNA